MRAPAIWRATSPPPTPTSPLGASGRRSRCCSRTSSASSGSIAYGYEDRTEPATSSSSPPPPRTCASSPSSSRWERRPPRSAPARQAKGRSGSPRTASAQSIVSTGAHARRADHSMILLTTPAPTVRPPSRMAKRSFSSMAIGVISSTSSSALSPGMIISTPSFSFTIPVTSVVRK